MLGLDDAFLNFESTKEPAQEIHFDFPTRQILLDRQP